MVNKIKRIIIVGIGFGGIELFKKLDNNIFQIILIDKNNYHTFQPLLYQVAVGELTYMHITTEIKNIIKSKPNVYFIKANLKKVCPDKNYIITNLGNINYDYLIISIGTTNNFFNNNSINKYSLPMKDLKETLNMKKHIYNNMNNCVKYIKNKNKIINKMRYVVVGGGPSGVEITGALCEVKKYTINEYFPYIKQKYMNIHIIQATNRLLDNIDKKLSKFAYDKLNSMGVNIHLNSIVTKYENNTIYFNNKKLKTYSVIWTAGVTGVSISGLSKSSFINNRILVNRYNKVIGYKNIFAIGDISICKKDKNFPNGYPMLAQVAIQQGRCLAMNIYNMNNNIKINKFKYINRGSMAIIAKNIAVIDTPYIKLHGFLAWIIWMIVHIIYLEGKYNKIYTIITWIYNYIYRSRRFIDND